MSQVKASRRRAATQRPQDRARSVVSLAFALALAWGGCGGEPSEGPADACAAGTGCGEACAPGNSYGVGRYCTIDGGECNETPNRLAPFCTVDYDGSADAFCTRPCDPTGDVLAQCGEDAICRAEDPVGGGPSGCVPASCVQ